ncbi:hypothetical protein Mapa_014498 [Marchantia paleacea]|nr:hypothetical protein Mapa_014498 [Marchantia paleacea]
MALAENIVGIIGNIISICLFLAPVKTFRKIIKAKSIMNFKSTPYVCTLLSVLLWSFYGLVKPATLIVTINGAGTFLEICYLICFLYYADRKARIKTSQSILLVLAIFGIVVASSLTATKVKDTRVMVSGIVSLIFSIIMYASPLRAMKMVVQTKSVTFMPFTLSAILLLNGTVWSLYALLVKDIYVGIPNGVGMVFGILQILLYVLYMTKSKNIQLEKEAEKSHMHSNCLKSDAPNGDHAIDMEKPALSSSPHAMEQDMKAAQDTKGVSTVQGETSPRTDAAPEFTNVPLEDKAVQDYRAPPSPTPLPTSTRDQMRPLSATD